MRPSRALLALPLALAAVALPLSVGDANDEAVAMSDLMVHPRSIHSSLETGLVEGLLDLRRGRLDEALGKVSDVIRQRPDFALAQLVYGDLLLAMSDRLPGFGSAGDPRIIGELRDEARARLTHYEQGPPAAALPENLLRLPPEAATALLVDLNQYRLFVFENREGRPVAAGDYYVSIGKGGIDKRREGDEKTPVGVYVVSSYLEGEELPDLYGVGAFPISYPNRWDRELGRTGSGIWIHGTESARYSRPPLSSRGCVTLSNPDFLDLQRRVEVGRTPVVVSGGVDWVAPGRLEVRRQELEEALERWRLDWESRDAERYLGHYAADFRTDEMDRQRFARHKRRVNPSKAYIRVELEELAIYSYPGETDLVLVEFLQRYDSDSFRSDRRKQQYWRRDGDAWRIVFETGV